MATRRLLAFAVAAAVGVSPVLTAAGSAFAHSQKGPCAEALEAAETPPPPGSFTPGCTGDGYYELIQYHGSTGESWCANPVTGARIDGTAVPPGSTPTCGKCVTLLAASYAPPQPGAYKPQCDAGGNFKPLQVHPATGRAWCADPVTGQRIGYMVPIGTPLTCQ